MVCVPYDLPIIRLDLSFSNSSFIGFPDLHILVLNGSSKYQSQDNAV